MKGGELEMRRVPAMRDNVPLQPRRNNDIPLNDDLPPPRLGAQARNPELERQVALMAEMGFPPERSAPALLRNGLDLNRALEELGME